MSLLFRADGIGSIWHIAADFQKKQLAHVIGFRVDGIGFRVGVIGCHESGIAHVIGFKADVIGPILHVAAEW